MSVATCICGKKDVSVAACKRLSPELFAHVRKGWDYSLLHQSVIFYTAVVTETRLLINDRKQLGKFRFV